ncbi:MAG: hypothetical protein ACK5TH_14630 [Prosthecobacter sp.]|jgi:hypothetical protein
MMNNVQTNPAAPMLASKQSAFTRFVRNSARIACGVLSIFALLGGAFCFLAAVVDGIYFSRLHSKMFNCARFVEAHIQENSMFPTSGQLQRWSNENGDLLPFRIGEPGADDSFTILDGQSTEPHFKKYRIAYWTGDRSEFFNAWDGTFTTSVTQYSGSAFVVGMAFFVAGAALYRIRDYLLKAQQSALEVSQT